MSKIVFSYLLWQCRGCSDRTFVGAGDLIYICLGNQEGIIGFDSMKATFPWQLTDDAPIKMVVSFSKWIYRGCFPV